MERRRRADLNIAEQRHRRLDRSRLLRAVGYFNRGAPSFASASLLRFRCRIAVIIASKPRDQRLRTDADMDPLVAPKERFVADAVLILTLASDKLTKLREGLRVRRPHGDLNPGAIGCSKVARDTSCTVCGSPSRTSHADDTRHLLRRDERAGAFGPELWQTHAWAIATLGPASVNIEAVSTNALAAEAIVVLPNMNEAYLKSGDSPGAAGMVTRFRFRRTGKRSR